VYDRLVVGGHSIRGSVTLALLGVGYSEGDTALFLLRLASVVEMTIVLSTGEYLTVNRAQYPDLFWALLGGRGGTYGILTSVTYPTYPSHPVAAAVMVIQTVRANTTQALSTELMRITPQLPDTG